MTTKEHTHDVADALIWLGIVAATVWAFGNAIGWISSSMRVDMIHISGGVATVAGISILVGQRCCRNWTLSSVMPEGTERRDKGD